MAVQGEDFAARIEAQIREAIDRMVGEIRSTVEDVREAVDQQFDAVLQSIEADVKSASFTPHIQEALREFEGEIPAAPAAPAPAGSDAAALKRAIRSVEKGRSQVEILTAFLEQSLAFASRSALFIVKGEQFSGWKGAGFGATGGNDENVKRFTGAPGSIPALARMQTEERVIEWSGADLAEKLGASAPKRAILIPMVIKDKVAAAMYADDVEGSTSLDIASLELLVFTTGLLIDTLAIRKKVPSPTLTWESEPAPADPPSDEPFGEIPTPPEPEIPRSTFGSQTVAVPSQPPATPPPAPPQSSPGFELASEPAPPKAPPPAAPSPQKTESGSTPAENLADRPSTQFIPPPGLARGKAFGGDQSDEAKKHDEAKRFARLLVSEIKLYNESKVEQGRKNNDLYERLREDIDRSRQMYDERIPEAVRKSSNYFYDELVRVLAEGNAESLGL